METPSILRPAISILGQEAMALAAHKGSLMATPANNIHRRMTYMKIQ